MYYVYTLKSKDYNEIYIGSTNNLRRRLFEHNDGMEISTRRYKPWRVAYYEAYESEEDARGREMKLKHHGNAMRELKKRIKQSLKNGAGFTLIELLVVTSIIVIISAIILPNYRAGDRQLSLQRAAHQLAQDLRRTQEMAMSAKEFQGEVPSRYGIEFGKNRNYYILFADFDDNGEYASGSSDIEVERINLEKGIKIQDLLTSSSKTLVWVAFKPPDPLTTIRDPDDSSILSIQLINDDNQIKVVSANNVGLISVE